MKDIKSFLTESYDADKYGDGEGRYRKIKTVYYKGFSIELGETTYKTGYKELEFSIENEFGTGIYTGVSSERWKNINDAIANAKKMIDNYIDDQG